MLLRVSGFKHPWKVGKRILDMYHGILCLHQQIKEMQDTQSPLLPSCSHSSELDTTSTGSFTLPSCSFLTWLYWSMLQQKSVFKFLLLLFSEQYCWKGKGRIPIKIVNISFYLGFVSPHPGYCTCQERHGHTRASPMKRNSGLSAAYSYLMWWYGEDQARLFSEMLSD